MCSVMRIVSMILGTYYVTHDLKDAAIIQYIFAVLLTVWLAEIKGNK